MVVRIIETTTVVTEHVFSGNIHDCEVALANIKSRQRQKRGLPQNVDSYASRTITDAHSVDVRDQVPGFHNAEEYMLNPSKYWDERNSGD